MIIKVLIGVTIVLLVAYIIYLGRDLYQHRSMIFKENGNFFLQGLFALFVQFCAVLGFSDFALNTPVYRATKWVDDARLPGTLIVGCGVPAILIAIIYISNVAVEPLSLILCIAVQLLGTTVGVRFVTRLPAEKIRLVMGGAIALSAVFVFLKLIGVLGGQGGTLIGFSAKQLFIVLPAIFILSALTMVGFGMKAPSIALFLTLGLDARTALLIVLSCCAIGTTNGAFRYIKSGRFQRKVVLASSIFGVIGVVIGSFFVQALNVDVLQWIILALLVYTAISMLKPKKKSDQVSEG